MAKDTVLRELLAARAVAVIRMTDPARLAEVAAAFREGGVTALEVTMTVPGAVGIIRALARERTRALVGAGTVLDAGRPLRSSRPGRISSSRRSSTGLRSRPAARPESSSRRALLRRPRSSRPGGPGPTSSRSFRRLRSGRFFRDVRGPLPDVRLMPTGGVTVENARGLFGRRRRTVGIGTALVDEKMVEADEWEALTVRAGRLVESLRGV